MEPVLRAAVGLLTRTGVTVAAAHELRCEQMNQKWRTGAILSEAWGLEPWSSSATCRDLGAFSWSTANETGAGLGPLSPGQRREILLQAMQQPKVAEEAAARAKVITKTTAKGQDAKKNTRSSRTPVRILAHVRGWVAVQFGPVPLGWQAFLPPWALP